jgi:hypothetical protein
MINVPYEFFEAEFENVCELTKSEMADRIILLANKLKTSDDATILQHIEVCLMTLQEQLAPEELS